MVKIIARYRYGLVKNLGDFDRFLSGHRVHNEQYHPGVDRVANLL
jgi:hypothetical protein